ncbi:MAG: hypothetical protein ACO29Z_07905 [Crocinitomicaceae bacterium]
MKTIFCIALLSLFSFGVQAQALFRGNFTATAYLGYPNIMRASMEINETIPFGTNVNYNGIAPSGLRLMYMIGDDVSVGLDFIYTQASARYAKVDTSFFNNQWNYVTNNYQISKQRFRPQFRFDIHLGSLNPNLDQYIGLAVGGNMRWRKVYVNDTLVSTQPNALDFVIPVSFRVCYGFQYLINYNLALSSEIGLGGPIFQGGLTYRF